MSVFSFFGSGTRAVFNIDSYIFSSIQGTIESIHTVLQNGRINDAYALLRKYHDSVIINTYSSLYLQENVSIDNLIVQKIDDWVQGKEKMPEYRVMSQYIKASEILKPINELLESDIRYKLIRDRCNDHTHYNFFQNILLNDNEIYLKNRIASVEVFTKDVENIFILHFAYLFYIKHQYMMSSDYVDAMDCGLSPEDGSQYFVAPFIQEIFDSVVKIKRPDIAQEIKRNTLMKLE
ncbi:MAG: hypothetical protein ACP5N7_04125 [Candidatus Pacearchaeota archaeon]